MTCFARGEWVSFYSSHASLFVHFVPGIMRVARQPPPSPLRRDNFMLDSALLLFRTSLFLLSIYPIYPFSVAMPKQQQQGITTTQTCRISMTTHAVIARQEVEEQRSARLKRKHHSLAATWTRTNVQKPTLYVQPLSLSFLSMPHVAAQAESLLETSVLPPPALPVCLHRHTTALQGSNKPNAQNMNTPVQSKPSGL